MQVVARLFSVMLLLGSVLAAAPVPAADPGYRAPEAVDGATTITAEEARALHKAGTLFVDVRSPRLYARRHIPGAHHLDLKSAYTEEALAAIAERDEPLVIYCSGIKCSRSFRASSMAVGWGYRDVRFFRGGIVDWRKAGYPVESASQ
jgi:rhodanese-related sulfurtransferase